MRRLRLHPSVPKIALVAAASAVGLFALFVVALNIFIQTRLCRSTIGYDPKSLLLDYDRAYSLWPGHIHVEGLVLRGGDWNVEWTLEIDRCDFQEHFLDLFHRQFHAGPVDCDGLSLRLRLREQAWTAAEAAAIPPIPGFSDPPRHPPGPEPPPLTDANYKLWSVRLDDVVARHVREIWVQSVRMTGDAEIDGRWVFRPMRWLEVGPARIAMHPLDVDRGAATPMVTAVRGDVEATVHPFDLRTASTEGVLPHVTVKGDVDAKVHVAEILRALAPHMQLAAGDAPVSARLDLDHGELRAGSRATAGPFHLRASEDAFSVEGNLRIQAAVEAGQRASADVTAREVVASVGAHALRGNVNVAVRARRDGAWTDLAGSGMSFTGAARANDKDITPPDWWLRAELRRGLVDADHGLRVRADVAVQAKDASPLTAAIAAETPLPTWLVNAVSTKGFETNGQILVSPSTFEARDVDARAQGVAARFAFLQRPPATDWALNVDVDALSATIDSHDGKAEVVLFGARSRFDERAATIRAAGVHE